MAGTIEGGLKTAATNKRKYGEGFYSMIGREGGKVSSPTKGFGTDRRTKLDKILGKPKLASIAGKKGGTISRRGPA